MVFWGIKLKPKHPYLLDVDQYDGRLHISNATLGPKPSEKKTFVKCKVGDGPDIAVCSLTPGKTESMNLDLEFDSEPVVFSVTGSCPVYLSGYFYDAAISSDEDESEDDEESSDLDGFIEDVADEDYDDEAESESEEEEERVPRSSVKIEEISEDDVPAVAKDDAKAGKDDSKDAKDSKAVQQENGGEGEEEDEDGFLVANKRKSINGKASEQPDAKKSKTANGTAATPGESAKKRKKEKKEAKAEQKADESPAAATEPTESAKKSKDVAGSAKKKFPNGLEIVELSMGKPDGKLAKPGKKVSIHYTGKLKSTGKVFDTSLGKKPLQFRLGVNEVVKGFDIGVAGMRVGDSRRIIIPPAMGYGSKAVGGIPPNSWLIFDIELVDVKG